MVFPDFYSITKGIVLDAKYKKMNGVGREDLYQIISYAYILQARSAGFVFPSLLPIKETDGILNGYGAEVLKLGIKIPQDSRNYSEFHIQMEESSSFFQRECETYFL